MLLTLLIRPAYYINPKPPLDQHLPAPPNYPLRDPKYHPIESMRSLNELHWGMLVRPFKVLRPLWLWAVASLLQTVAGFSLQECRDACYTVEEPCLLRVCYFKVSSGSGYRTDFDNSEMASPVDSIFFTGSLREHILGG